MPNADSSPPATPAMPAPTSVWSKMANVIAAPGEVFDELAAAPAAVKNWLMPTLLACLVGIIYTFVVSAQPAILQQLSEQQQAPIEEKVQAGKLTRQQADQQLAMLERFSGPGMFRIMGTAGSVVITFITLLGWALVVWVVGRTALKTELGFGKAVEIVGLAFTVRVLGGIVAMLLAVAMGSLYATPSPALFVKEYNATNLTHAALSTLNFFNLWFVALLALGLAHIGRRSFGRSAGWLFGFWAVFSAALAALSQLGKLFNR